MSNDVKIVTGTIVAGVGALTGQGWLVTSGLGLISSGLTGSKKPYIQTEAPTRIGLPTDRLPVVYGSARIPGSYIFIGNSVDKTVLWMVVALGHGEIEAVDEIFIDGNLAVHADGTVRHGGQHGTILSATPAPTYPAVIEIDVADALAVGDRIQILADDGGAMLGTFDVIGQVDSTHFTINGPGFGMGTPPDPGAPTLWVRTNPNYNDYLDFAKYLGPDNQDMSTTGKQVNLVGAARTNGSFSAGALSINVDSAGSLVGVAQPGDTFTIAGEAGSPVHIVTGYHTASGNAIPLLTFATPIAGGGVANHAAITFSHVGFTANTLKAQLPEWDATHILGGVAYILLRLKANDQIYLHSLPAVQANVRGRKIYDPRGPSTAFSTNPALCARDLMTNTRYGWALPAAKINDGNSSFGVIAEANYHETQPYEPAGAGLIAVSSVSAASDLVTTAAAHGLVAGDKIWIRGVTGTTPALLDGTYTVAASGLTTTKFSIDDGMGGFINFTVGTGPGGTIQKVVLAAARHATNGLVDCNQPIGRNLEAVLSSGRAEIIRIGSFYQPFTRRALGLTITPYVLDDRRLRGGSAPLRLTGLQGSANGLDVTFVDRLQNFQQVTIPWPPANVTNTFLADDDGIANRKSLQLPLTNDRYMTQRIANAILEELRAQSTFTPTTTEELLQASAGDVIPVTNRIYGWGPTESSPGTPTKLFWVNQLGLRPDQLIDAILVEYQPTCYDDVLMDDATFSPLTSLASPWVVQPPTLAPGAHLVTSGTPDPRLHVEWISAADASVDHYEVQAQRTTSGAGVPVDPAFRDYGRADGDTNGIWISNVANGDVWVVRVRAVNKLGVASDWLQETHTAVIIPGASLSVVRTTTSGLITYTVTAGGTTRHIKIYSVENAGAGGANPLESITNLTDDRYVAAGGVVVFTVPTTASHYRRALIVAYDESYKRGDDSGFLEDQAVTSGAGPSAPPSALGSTSVTASSFRVTFTVGDATAPTRVYINGIYYGQAPAAQAFLDISGLVPSTAYQVTADHFKNGIANPSTPVGPITVTTSAAGAAPASFTITAGPYDPGPIGGKDYINYDVTWSNVGAWEIYESSINDVTTAAQFLLGASGTTATLTRRTGPTGPYYYWVRGTSPTTGWTPLTGAPLDYAI